MAFITVYPAVVNHSTIAAVRPVGGLLVACNAPLVHGMYTAVGAPTPVQFDLRAAQLPQRLFDHALYCDRIRLDLPSAVSCAVICQLESKTIRVCLHSVKIASMYYCLCTYHDNAYYPVTDSEAIRQPAFSPM